MSFSINTYAGNGSTTQFPVTFHFISRSDVGVYVDGVQTTDFSWVSDSLIAFTTAPANGAVVTFKRITPITSRVVDFQDASVLTEKDLDTSFDQLFYVGQEAFDAVENTVALDTDGVFDSQGKRIKNIADPINPQDAVTKAYGDANYGGAAAISAENAATQAQQYLSQFKGIYYGQLAGDPAVDPNGNPCTISDLYYDSTLDTLKVYTGVVWQAVSGGAGATGGMGDQAFFENDTNIAHDYTIKSGKNAMSAGPITINNGVTVTVPSGSTWTIV